MAWKYYALYIALDFLVVAVAYFHFPETRRLSIEEISLVFDYGTKEGRERALHDLENARNRDADPDAVNDESGEGKLTAGDGATKPAAQHLETTGRR